MAADCSKVDGFMSEINSTREVTARSDGCVGRFFRARISDLMKDNRREPSGATLRPLVDM